MHYQDFAWFYDRYWASEAVAWELLVLEKLLLPELSVGAKVLDIGCGSGHLAGALAARGLSVTGADLAPQMIELARRHAPAATFHVVDVRNLQSDAVGTFDAAVSMYDSLNHLLSLEDLQAAFTAVSSCLADGGWLVFDLNTRAGIEAWGPMSKADDAAAFVVEAGFDPVARRGEFHFTGFRRNGPSWQRAEVRLEQTWFEDGDVHQALLSSGFRQVSLFDRAQLLGAEPTGKKQVFLARKDRA